jgi:hypothetical protein
MAQTGPYKLSDIDPPSGATPASTGGQAETPSMLSTIGGGIANFGKGVVKGGMNTIRGLGSMEAKIPSLKSLMPGDVQDYLGPEGEKMNATHGTMQGIGKGVEQAGEFMLPGGAEEKLAAKAPAMLRPLARIAASALSSGAINKVQGGNFGTGALMGAGGSAVGQGLKAAAPIVAETALGIPKAARAFGKTPGAAILNETRGIRPETVASSAQERMGQLTPELESAADAASSRPAPRIAGFLPPPREEVPLAPIPAPRNPKMRPMAFPAQIKPEEGLEPRSGNPMAPISEYPAINPHFLSGSAHPELSGRVTPIQNPEQVTTRMGVLLRRPEISASIPPTIEPNASASLRPARNIVSSAADSAVRQNAEGLHGQLTSMGDTLSRRFDTHEPIPENVTPRQLLDLKRGFSDQHLRWNPEIHDRALSTGRQAYNALDQELDRTVPEAAGLNQRISSLIPVARRAESVSRNAPTLQRAAGRFGAHTGALTLGAAGAYEGRREGGLPGMIAGGVTGVLAPELIASPEGQMLVARSLNKAGSLKPAVGALLQGNRKKDSQ